LAARGAFLSPLELQLAYERPVKCCGALSTGYTIIAGGSREGTAIVKTSLVPTRRVRARPACVLRDLLYLVIASRSCFSRRIAICPGCTFARTSQSRRRNVRGAFRTNMILEMRVRNGELRHLFERRRMRGNYTLCVSLIGDTRGGEGARVCV